MIWFAIASLSPAVLLTLACIFGGIFPALGLLSITILVFCLDKLSQSPPASAINGRALNYLLVGAHFSLLPLSIWEMTHGTHLTVMDKILIFVGLGLYFGQISNSNAHDLIHASSRSARRLGALVYISLLNGHHISAHLRVHHVHAATARDPNSAAPGVGFWRYYVRALVGEFTLGLQAETQRRSRLAVAETSLSHPYVGYVGGAAVSLAVSFAIGGIPGVLFHLGIAAYAQLQLLLSDYVQHYGLRRRLTASGKPEPVGPHHSWNAPAWYSAAMMLNAPLHSDHHMHPAKRYPDLDINAGSMPILPHSLPVMAVLALVPPLWHRVMDRRLARWQDLA